MPGRAGILGRLARAEDGIATVEAAFAILGLVATLVVCAAGLTSVSMQIRCVDAAREAARLAARGDEPAAVRVAREVAPAGAQVLLHRRGEFVVATVTSKSTLLPGVSITADSVAAAEPAYR